MSESTWDRVKEIFQEAAALSAGEREPHLDRACAGNDRLRAEVEALLESHDELRAVAPETVTKGDDAPTESTGTVIGRYKLLQQIGEGGFGAVYMAEQEEPVRRRVALKIIKLGMDTKQVIARFEAERQALALMDHPNIAKVLDAGATEVGRPYFVMELVRGIPITEYCDQNKLATKERLELFMTVCGAIQHAHQKGIIHRDIKPSNVMVTLHDGIPVPMIIDFGIAKATNQRLTERTLFTEYNQFIGTPAYMSPEQAEMSGLDVDTRSDIYSLGVLLYELLTGTTPLDSQQLRQVAYSELQRMIREEEPHKPSERISTLGQSATAAAEHQRTDLPGLAKALRGDLDWVVMKALEKDRTRRYETANAMRNDLRRFLANEPVSASPPSRVYRLRKFVQRNRTGVIVGATVTFALVAGFLLAAAGYFQARSEAEASKAINGFFSDMLASVDPRYLRQFSGFSPDPGTQVAAAAGVAYDVSVVEMMLRSRRHIEASFSGKPTLEATARETIGLSLLGLGRPREAAEELSIAAEIRRDVLGVDHSETLRSELQHAMSLTGSGRAPESIPVLCELRRKMTRSFGEHDPRTLQASSLYATALMQDGKFDASDTIFREALKRQTVILGPEHRDTIETTIWWTSSHSWRGRGAEGEALLRPAYEAALRVYGPDDVQTLYARDALGWTLLFQGDYAGAESLIRPALESLARVVGDEHPFTCSAKMGLGRALPDTAEEKVQLWTEALEGLRVSEGKASPWIFVISRDLARLLLRLGRTEEGLHLLRRAVEDFRDTYGEDHKWTTLNMKFLAQGLRKAGQPAEALAVSKRRLGIRRRQAEEPEAGAEKLNDVAWSLLNWDPPELRDPVAALTLSELALELAGDEKRAMILDTLALAQHQAGRNTDALATQRKALALIPVDDPKQRTTYIVSLVKYLSSEGALSEMHTAVVDQVRYLDTVSESAADFVLDIGGFSNRLAEKHLHEQAELARREALGIVRARWDDDPVAVAGLLYRIGRALLHQGMARDAEKLLRQGVARARETDDEEVLARNQVNLAEAIVHQGRYEDASVMRQ